MFYRVGLGLKREGEECDSDSGSPRIGGGTLLQSSARRGTMDIISQLKAERAKINGQLHALDTAISALSGTERSGGSHGPRRMNAAARAKISAAQKARWATAKGRKVVPIKAGKRRISAAGLANIRAATKARWARWRAAKK